MSWEPMKEWLEASTSALCELGAHEGSAGGVQVSTL